MSAPPVFNVTLHHLAPDAKTAGIEFADVQFAGVTAERLRTMLEALTGIAADVAYPVAPEMRILASEGQFLVQVKEGRVRFSSWSTRAGGDLTPAEIVAAITGVDPADAGAGHFAEMTAVLQRPRRIWQVALLVAGILATNGVTVWMLTRPRDEMLPAYRLLEADPAERLLANVAGTYETGSAEGDRQLRIDRGGGVRWVKFGLNRSVVEESTLTVQAAQTSGHPALLTSTRTLIEIKDPMTVVMFGDTYRRKQS